MNKRQAKRAALDFCVAAIMKEYGNGEAYHQVIAEEHGANNDTDAQKVYDEIEIIIQRLEERLEKLGASE